MEGNETAECFACKTNLSLPFFRKLRCRLCSQKFCSNCATFYVQGLLIGQVEDQARVCKFCYDIVQLPAFNRNIIHYLEAISSSHYEPSTSTGETNEELFTTTFQRMNFCCNNM